MRHDLLIHPASPAPADIRIDVEVAERPRDHVVLSYGIRGRIGGISLPGVTTPARRDELWRHTCFEAFVGAVSSPAYFEFNFSPTTAWAAYRFDDYRAGMTAAPVDAPRIDVQSSLDAYTLQVALDVASLPDLDGGAIWRLGVAAVIEDTHRHLSYWALKHPAGRPDFHHAAGFALELLPEPS
jgi:hypothetical protein